MTSDKQYLKKTRVKLGALWHKTTGAGQVILSGKLEDGRSIVIFPNGYKQEAKHPDFVLYLEVEEGESAEPPVTPAPRDPSLNKLKQAKIELQSSEEKEDEFPF